MILRNYSKLELILLNIIMVDWYVKKHLSVRDEY